MGLFGSFTTVSSDSAEANESKKLRALIEALRKKDESVLLDPRSVPSSVSSGNQQLAAEAFATCIECEDSIGISRMLRGHAASGLSEDSITAIAKQLLSAGLDPNTQFNGEPLIFTAVKGNGSQERYTELLIEYGADLSVTNNNGYSPLGAQLKNGLCSLGYLFEPYVRRNARLNGTDLSDFEVYASIFQYGCYDIAKTIPRTKLESFSKKADSKSGLTLLHLAAGGRQMNASRELQAKFKEIYLNNSGYPALVELLLDCGADPRQQSNSGYNASDIALLFGHDQVHSIIEKRMDSGALPSNIDEPLGGMGTALFNACVENDAETVRSLLDAGVDPNVRSFVNYPENELFKPGIHPEVGALLYTQSMAGHMNPLFFHKTELGLTNLYFSTLHGNVEISHLLLNAGADPNAICLNGLFPLYIAAEIGNLQIARDLVEHGADVNKTTPKGCTPILNAGEEGKLDVVRYLLKNGADPYICNNAGKNAIEASIENGQMTAAQIMRDY